MAELPMQRDLSTVPADGSRSKGPEHQHLELEPTLDRCLDVGADTGPLIASVPFDRELSGSTLVDGPTLGSPIALPADGKLSRRGSPGRQRMGREYHVPPRFNGHPRFAYHHHHQHVAPEPSHVAGPAFPLPARQQTPGESTATALQRRVPTQMVPPPFGSQPASPSSMFFEGGGGFTFHPDAAFVASSEAQQRRASDIDTGGDSQTPAGASPVPVAALESEASLRVAVAQLQAQNADLTQAFVNFRDAHGQAYSELGAAVRSLEARLEQDASRVPNGPGSSSHHYHHPSPTIASSPPLRRAGHFPSFLATRLHEQEIATLREQLAVLQARFDFTFGPLAPPTPTQTPVPPSAVPSFDLTAPPNTGVSDAASAFQPLFAGQAFAPHPTSAHGWSGAGAGTTAPAVFTSHGLAPSTTFAPAFMPQNLPTPVPSPAPTLSQKSSMYFHPPGERRTGLMGGGRSEAAGPVSTGPTVPMQGLAVGGFEIAAYGGWQPPANSAAAVPGPTVGLGVSFGPASPSFSTLERKRSGHFGLTPPTSAILPPNVGLPTAQALLQNAGAYLPVLGSGTGHAPSSSLAAKWYELGLTGEVLKSICGYRIGAPSQMQSQSVPAMLKGSDVIAQAPLTPERIAAYVLPALVLVASNLGVNGCPPRMGTVRDGLQVLCVTATYDQAAQAHRVSNGIGAPLGIVSGLCAGAPGDDMAVETERFKRHVPHIIFGTATRLLQLQQKGGLPTEGVVLLVIDQVDQIFARGFDRSLRELESVLPPPAIVASDTKPSGALGGRKGRQTAMFSWVYPGEVMMYTHSLGLVDPVRIFMNRDRIADSPPSIHNLRQSFKYLHIPPYSYDSTKPSLEKQLDALGATKQYKAELFCDFMVDLDFVQCLVWCTSVDTVRTLAAMLRGRGINALAHDQDGSSTMALLARFRSAPEGRNGKKVVVAYDAFARTFDRIHQTSLVINYDLPRSVGDYAWRVACAAHPPSDRSKPGTVINILTPGVDVEMQASIERFYKTSFESLPNDPPRL